MCLSPSIPDLPPPPKPPAVPPPPTPMAKEVAKPVRKKRIQGQRGTSALRIRRQDSVNTQGLDQSSGIGLY